MTTSLLAATSTSTFHMGGMFGGWLLIGILIFTVLSWVVIIWAVIDIVRRPEDDFVVLGTPRYIPILVVLLVGIIGPILYLAIWRSELNRIRAARLAGTPMAPKSATAPLPTVPPPGWYPMQGDPVGVSRWWDGARWTAHTHGTAMPPPSPPVGPTTGTGA